MKFNPADYEERTEPKFFEFSKPNDGVAGQLVSIEPIMVGELKKRTNRYVVEDEFEGMVCFLGTYQIDTKLKSTDVGRRIVVLYEGEDSSVSRNGNNMKKFKVLVAKKNAHGLEITDSDLPESMRA